MSFTFEKSAQVQAVQYALLQNNILYEGRYAILNNMDLFYDGLELDTEEKKFARWKRTPFFIYYPKVVSSFNSSIFKKPPHYTLPDGIDLDNVDLLKNSINEYVTQIPFNILKHGYCATIVDYSNDLNRPYLKFIKPELFVSLQTSNTKGYPEIAKFIYEETEEVQDETNEFKLKTQKIHYVWDLYEEQVRVRKYRRAVTQEDLPIQLRVPRRVESEDILESTNMITQDGEPLTKLPIIIHGKETNNYTIDKSVLHDVSDLNIDVFNATVDQKEVLHMTALPTPYITGIDPDDPTAPKTIGSNKLWLIENVDSKIGLLEFNGKSYEAHKDFIESIKDAMAVQGAQILKRGGVSRETATSVIIRTGQETAIITDIVNNASSQIEEVLKLYVKWYKKPTDKVSYKLNSDFVNVDMEPNAQIALVRSWLDGAVSHRTVFDKMKEGEIIKPNKSFEEEMDDIKSNPPPFPAKEKDAKIAEDAREDQAAIDIMTQNMTTESESENKSALEQYELNDKNQEDSDREMNGSNLETGNEIANNT